MSVAPQEKTHIKEQDKSVSTVDSSAIAPAATAKLTKKEQEALARYEKTHHLAAIPHEDPNGYDKSSGEQLFNAVTYKGIGWLTNAAMSVYFTDLLMHGSGKPFFDTSIKKLAPFFQRITGGTIEAAQKTARGTMMTMGLFSGGTLLLYPIKKLEDHKAAIVKWLDKKLNNIWEPSKEDIEIQDSAHKRLESDPKPSWPNIILGRVLGTAAVFVAILGVYNPENSTRYFAKKTGEAMQESANQKIKALGGSERFRNLFALSIIEVYTSLIAEEVLYYCTRFYRSMHRKKAAELAENGKAANGNGELHAVEPLIALQAKKNNMQETPSTQIAEHVIAGASSTPQLQAGTL